MRSYNVVLDSVNGDLTAFASVKKLPYVDWAVSENKRRRELREQKNRNKK